MIQIFSKHSSARLEYICDVLFKHVLKTDFTIVVNISELETSLPIINYSKEVIGNSVQVIPSGLLFEQGITDQELNVEEDCNFFKTSDTNDVKFDIFVSSFYMVSRYEEYLYSDLDIHQRFKAENSLAFKNGFLKKAVVNRWAIQLKEEISKRNTDYSFVDLEYKYISSFDIDSAYAYKHKGIMRLAGGGVKSIIKGDFEDVLNRVKYLLGLQDDPFDVYDYLFEINNTIDTILFFLVGKIGPFDKNISINSTGFQELIKLVFSKTNIGIHPSYNSNTSIGILKSEVDIFSKIINRDVENSRHHFLKLSLPDTYNKLIELGIKRDYSMGFASQIGFRAGICTPYPFFDLSNNKKTELMIHPFQIMDVTLNQYQKLEIDEALKSIKLIYEEVKSVDGTFVTLWHNESLSEIRNWKGWKNVFEKMVKLVKD